MASLIGCGKSENPPPQPQSLWAYLETFRSKTQMPTTDEIVSQFGKPDTTEIEMNLNATASFPDDKQFLKFTDEDKKSKWVHVVAWTYFFKGDRNRWVNVLVRKSDGSATGWEWFENVPPGQEIGPPK